MNEPTLNEIKKLYADALYRIDSLRRELEAEKAETDALRLRILNLQDQIAGACV